MGDPRNPIEAAAPTSQAPSALGEPLARLDRLREATRVFAHDLKNPLSALLLGLQRIARFAAPDHQAQARALTARLESTVQTMNRLVEGLADLARYVGGELRLEPAPRPAAEVIERAVEPLRPAAAERRQEVVLALPAALPVVEWDVERVSQALQHLLALTLRSSPEGAEIRCSASVREGRVVVQIEGPAPHPLPSLAPLLSAADPGRRRAARDLGVLVARALAEAHGGALELEEEPERGAVYRLALPLLIPAP
jgi:signal transduction histidine kinase